MRGLRMSIAADCTLRVFMKFTVLRLGLLISVPATSISSLLYVPETLLGPRCLRVVRACCLLKLTSCL